MTFNHIYLEPANKKIEPFATLLISVVEAVENSEVAFQYKIFVWRVTSNIFSRKSKLIFT